MFATATATPHRKKNMRSTIDFSRRQGVVGLVFMLAFLLAGTGRSFGQKAEDSATRVVTGFYARYQKGTLAEKDYLDSVSKTMRLLLSKHIFFRNKELLTMLSPYRKIIWDGKYNERYKQEYYAILSNQAKMTGRDGEMLYYAEKMMDEVRTWNSGSFITPLTFLSDYYNNKNAYHRTLELYRKNRTSILALPEIIRKQELDSVTLVRTSNLLNYLGRAAYHEQDTTSAKEIGTIIDQELKYVQTQYSTNRDAYFRLLDTRIEQLYQKGVCLKSPSLQWDAITKKDSLSHDEHVPEYLRGHLKFSIIDNKTVFFLEQRNIDSAQYYIDLITQQFNQTRNPYDAYIVAKYTARGLYNQGKYKESTDTLRRAIELVEEFVSNNASEASDMMYAQAKVEDQQIVLAEADAKQKKTDRLLLLIGSGAVLLLLTGISAFVIIRQRQKAKFLEFKLNLARNIHDEANPALLYAKTLAKAKRAGEGLSDKSELELHIDHTMELIRSLAHDLKSDKQYSVADLISNIRETLGKLSIVGEFQYQIHEKVDDKRFLSHYQFSQLKAVLQECITNTLKHAAFSRIDLFFSNQKDKLNIIYKDNGNGWSEQSSNGIGLDNMTQRIQKLNADVTIDNHYPEGYQIDLSVKLH
ncbi:Signal transduction histidine-protein kinase/phosphatase DegS [compost metagenome]